jgi:flagellar secretion chaperone FliS
MRNPALAYRQSSVQGSTPLGRVVMLYDGAITFLNRALAAIEAGDIQKKTDHLKRALAIFAQLEGSLNFEQGGEVARTLKAFYSYARTQALKASLENSLEMLRALIQEFTEVRDAWQEGERRLADQNINSHEVERRVTAQAQRSHEVEPRVAPQAQRSPAHYGGGNDWDEAGTVRFSIIE